MGVEVVKNIKIPVRNGSKYGKGQRGATAKWPLSKLKVGDGFYAECKDANAVRVSIQHHQRWYPGKKFTTFKDGDMIGVKRTK